jgi:hypothetical protein
LKSLKEAKNTLSKSVTDFNNNDIKNTNTSIIFEYSEEQSKFKLKDTITYHFYVSHNLCGDASVYPIELDMRTGSKPIKEENCNVIDHWNVPNLLRYKPGIIL